MRSLVFNLKDPKNPKLRMRLMDKDLLPFNLVNSDPKEIASDTLIYERKKLAEANLESRRTDWAQEQMLNSGKNVGFFTCKKCGSKNTTYY